MDIRFVLLGSIYLCLSLKDYLLQFSMYGLLVFIECISLIFTTRLLPPSSSSWHLKPKFALVQVNDWSVACPEMGRFQRIYPRNVSRFMPRELGIYESGNLCILNHGISYPMMMLKSRSNLASPLAE